MILRDKDRQAIIKLAESTFPTPISIWAYGSRVNGTAHDMSDLDLVLVSQKKETIDYESFENFKEQLRESNIPIVVQVMDWHRIPEHFKKNILNSYEELVTLT